MRVGRPIIERLTARYLCLRMCCEQDADHIWPALMRESMSLFFGTPRGLGLATATTSAAFLPHCEQRSRGARALSVVVRPTRRATRLTGRGLSCLGIARRR